MDLTSVPRRATPALEAVGEEVVEAGGAVEGGVALAGGYGVAVLRLGGGFGGGAGTVGLERERGIRAGIREQGLGIRD